ncbi:MAG: hypothetical protein QOI03_170 [Solirubrobacteraceae bacterium]|jgi:chloramphenicol 3-O-phosphotransferase|nr:hypothetical protein [Solirubrobacteraceae bacterium]
MVAALVLTGAPGTGKSSVLEALTTLLETEGIDYGSIECEQLAMGSPLLSGREWTQQLDAVLALQRTAGRRRFLIAATIETVEELRAVVSAAQADLLLVVCLSAPAEVVAARIADREPDRWPGKARLIAHARELALAVPAFDGIDLIVDTEGRIAEEVAADIHDAMKIRGLITA